MKQLLTLGMVAALLAFACAAHAYPNLSGSTGYIQAPTASVIAPGSFGIAADYVGSKDDNNNQKDSYPIRLQYGVMNALEVGFGYDGNAFDGKSLWNINAKYKLPYEFSGIQTAVGASYGQTPTLPDWGGKELKATQLYVAGTDKFNVGIPLGVTLGVNWTQLQNVNKNSGWRIQLGADAEVYKNTWILADLQSIAKMGDMTGHMTGQKNLWSLGARYAFTQDLSAEAGVTNGMYIGETKKANFFVGVDYVFGLVEQNEKSAKK